MADSAEQEDTFDIRRILDVLRRRWWIVAVVTIVSTIAALALSLSKPDQYQSVASVRVTDPNSSSVLQQSQGVRDPQREIDTQIEVMKSPEIDADAKEQLGVRARQVSRVSFVAVGKTDVVRVVVVSQDPTVAQAAAQAYADVYVADRQRQTSGSLRDRADELRRSADAIDERVAALDYALGATQPPDTTALQSQLVDLQSQRNAATSQQGQFRTQAASLEATGEAGAAAAADLRNQANILEGRIGSLNAQISTLTAQLSSSDAAQDGIDGLLDQKEALLDQQTEFRRRASEFDVESVVREGDVEVIAAAKLPAQPFAPTPRRNAMMGFILGLILGCGVAFLVDRLDDRLRAADDIQDLVGAPVMGAVLIDSDKKRTRLGALPKSNRHLVLPDSLDSEAYRTLATSLRFSSLGQDKQVVAVTSASGSEGKSTVTSNLAAALVDSGLSVVLVSADLRRPAIGEIFDIAETKEPGLADALLGTIAVADVVRTVGLPSGRTLRFVPSGTIPPNPAELLASRRLSDLLLELSRDADYVLLDCPPVLPVSDVLGIAQFVDGVVMLAVPGRSRTHQLAEACDRLRNVGVGIFGVVLNGVPRQPGRYATYQHYYRRYEPRSLPPQVKA